MKRHFLIGITAAVLLASGSAAALPLGETAPGEQGHGPNEQPTIGEVEKVGGGHAGEKLSCDEILREEEGEEHNPAVADVIFHHVTDNYSVEFESPFSHSKAGWNFKKVECQLFHWNGVVQLGSFPIDLTPTKHTFWMWIASLLLIALFWSSAPKKGQIVPKGMGTLLEIIVVFVRDELARKNIPGKEADRYTPYLLNVFFFILIMNFLGLVPYAAAATSNIGVTLALALFTFVFTQAAGIRSAGLGGYLKHLTGGVHPALWPIMIPVEFLGLFTKPFALTIRLFANMVAGHIVIFFLLGLIFIMKTVALAAVSVPFAFAIYLLEIFVALVQAYVFAMLSALFIGMSASMGHHGHGESESGEHGAHAEHAVHH